MATDSLPFDDGSDWDAQSVVGGATDAVARLGEIVVKGGFSLLAVSLWVLLWGSPALLNYRKGRYADAALAGVLLVAPVVYLAVQKVQEHR